MATATTAALQGPRKPTLANFADPHTLCTELVMFVDALEVMNSHDSQVNLGGSQLFAVFHTIKAKADAVMTALETEVGHA